MCGLVGFWGPPQGESGRLIKAMADRLVHRGPDSGGIWKDDEAGVALGHRRLSIIDLSPAGHQPMTSVSGRYVLVFNGEIYNHLELRAELEARGQAPNWQGHSDTETLVAGCDVWGVGATIERAIGMFAFSIWDRQERKLILGRDRMGEKPLYYGWQGEGSQKVFLFGSELRALQAHPSCDSDIDRAAVAEFMRYGHVNGGHSIYRGLHRLAPGCLAEVSQKNYAIAVTPYWTAAGVAQQPKILETPDVAIDALEVLLKAAVERQMLADVPLGAFLSGGIDSSLVVALMQARSRQPIQTFTIGFREPRYNEAEFAAQVASHLGTKHTELYVEDADLRDVIPMLPDIYDEPFADASQIPTFLVSRLAKDHVSVALSGDGGDELFCGYDRYRQGTSLMRWLHAIPVPIRRVMAGTAQAIPERFWDYALSPLRKVPAGKEPNGQWVHRMADYAGSPSIEILHRKLVSRWRNPDDIVLGGKEPFTLLNARAPLREGESDAERMMLLDQLTYLPNDILTKVDRASMHVSLETRAPFLDHKVVEFAGRLPVSMKLYGNTSKWALRQVLYRYLPAELIERPKMGFEVPVGIWLRGPLRDWAEDLLSPQRLRESGFLNEKVVRQSWGEHLSGRFNWGLHLWNILMFLSWQRREGALIKAKERHMEGAA